MTNTDYIQEELNEFKEKHGDLFIVYATDKFMSGWGEARNGKSKCGWIVSRSNRHKMLEWVRERDEMIYVNWSRLETFRPRNFAHFSYYLANNTHPAFS